jgi:hypothetical protein
LQKVANEVADNVGSIVGVLKGLGGGSALESAGGCIELFLYLALALHPSNDLGVALTLLTSFVFDTFELVLHVENAALGLFTALRMRASIFLGIAQLRKQFVLLLLQNSQVSLGVGSPGGVILETADGLLRREQARLEALDTRVGFANGVVERLQLIQQGSILLDLAGVLGLEGLFVHLQAFDTGSQVKAIAFGIGHVSFMSG